ncbi:MULTISPECIES: hypothetical protein [Actinomycetes]|uniref:ABC transporter ATP-binding protein n=2 Tax=Actinomycetes TaxID=1760 RepID=A0ABP6LM02_9MICC|nr:MULTISPECIES: hypothetical protein [unclassified Nesterenkonia]MDS2171408.1 hypothetical protein [Nesterenkonia sp. CL21]OSM44416.1 hypothetical protein BCY76_002595 [Nesterenkonia sp. PF2B19]
MKNQHPASVRAGRPGRAALTAGEGLTSLLRRLHTEERGDVPGWVMITLMSAVLVAGLLAVAQPALQGLFSDAIDQVSR